MKYLVATKHTQGAQRRDFCLCEEGEPVLYPPDREYSYLVGAHTQKGTTTVMVKEGFQILDLLSVVARAMNDGKPIEQCHNVNNLIDSALDDVKSLAYYASIWDEGTILSVGGEGQFYLRVHVEQVRKDPANLLDAIINALRMIEGARDNSRAWADLSESTVSLFEEIEDELKRVLPETIQP